VPELARRRAVAARAFADASERGSSGWYTAMRDYQRAEEALTTARWQVACASYRWVRAFAELRGDRDDAYWWLILRGVARLRWIRRSSGLMDYLAPSQDLVVRESAEVTR
jgi:hypothetical protein